jgi:hypothetical protein
MNRYWASMYRLNCSASRMMSSTRLFGTMRPTNRKFVSPSLRIFSSGGCGGADAIF